MKSIGVRELRQEASRWLAKVRAGETVVVTDRGRPIAKLVPFAESQGYDALVRSGGISPGSGRSLDEILDELDRTYKLGKGSGLSDALTALREDER
jgi:prevent-host-death family protein